MGEKALAHRSPWPFSDTHGGSDRLRQQIGRRQRREIDQPDTARKLVHEARRKAHRQSRLSCATGARQRQQT